MKKIGPGVLIAAAFVGPGTVTTCTLAGISYGYSLLWAVLFSVLATMVLQEMAARIGIISQKGLVGAISQVMVGKWTRNVLLSLVLLAILIGNAAYEGGNIGGAVLGLEAIFGVEGTQFYPFVIGAIVFVLLWVGNYQLLERTFVILISLMSLSFLTTAILSRPDWGALVRGFLVPTVPKGGILMVVALIGTTIVPYNLFLHASLAQSKWKSKNDLKEARWDTIISIGLGGMVSMAILVTGAAAPLEKAGGVLDLAKGLEPLFGDGARYVMGIGLFAAGITSSITAPLAAAFVASNCFGWEGGLKNANYRMVWITVLLFGVASLQLDFKPIQIIKFAQVTNGILLPLLAVLLVWISGQSAVMGSSKNTQWQNLLGILICVVCLMLGAKSVGAVFGWL